MQNGCQQNAPVRVVKDPGGNNAHADGRQQEADKWQCGLE